MRAPRFSARRPALPNLTDETFSTTVRDDERVVLVEFTAAWCAPCRAMVPTLTAIAADRSGVLVATVDVDESPGVASVFGVRAMPTLMLFWKGR